MIASERHLSTYSDAQKMDMIATAERSIFSRFYLKGSVIRERHTTKYSFVVNPITSTETHWAYILPACARFSALSDTKTDDDDVPNYISTERILCLRIKMGRNITRGFTFITVSKYDCQPKGKFSLVSYSVCLMIGKPIFNNCILGPLLGFTAML